MALHDFICPSCRWVAVDVNVPISVGASQAQVICPECRVQMSAIPGIGRMDAANGPGFHAFETYDGRNQKITVTSLKQLRSIERESEQLYQRGEGQPIVFRAFSNTRSQMDQSALHKSWEGGEQPTAEGKQRFGSTLQKSTEAPQEGYGPGVSDANASALPE